jgi:hypothetical protein
MRLFKTLFIAAIAVFVATTASALITVTHTNDAAGPLNIGDTFVVDITVGYDGNPAGLTGIFTSAGWDPAELSLVGTTGPAQPFAIFFGGGGFLGKVVDGGQSFPGDTPGTTRAVQYQAGPGQSGGAGADTLILSLVFQVVGAGDGTANVDVVFNNGDGIFVNAADTDPSNLQLTGTSVALVPEPGTALLMSLGLAGLASAGRRNR